MKRFSYVLALFLLCSFAGSAHAYRTGALDPPPTQIPGIDGDYTGDYNVVGYIPGQTVTITGMQGTAASPDGDSFGPCGAFDSTTGALCFFLQNDSATVASTFVTYNLPALGGDVCEPLNSSVTCTSNGNGGYLVTATITVDPADYLILDVEPGTGAPGNPTDPTPVTTANLVGINATPAAVTPEPSSIVLLSSGAAFGLFLIGRRRGAFVNMQG